MIPSIPSSVCEIIGSFFQKGAVSGEKLEKMKEQTSIASSYDERPVDSVSLNCVSDVHAIAIALFENPANSCVSVASEEDEANTKGIIYEVLHRRKEDIEEEEQKTQRVFMKASHIPSDSLLRNAVLNNIICKDEIFIKNLQEKTHRTALFVFDIVPEEDDVDPIKGCKEVRRKDIPPDRIRCVIVPMKYRDEILKKGSACGIPLGKVRYVEDTEKDIAFSYRDVSGEHPRGKVGKLKVPDYGSELRSIAEEIGDIHVHPLFLHMTRLTV